MSWAMLTHTVVRNSPSLWLMAAAAPFILLSLFSLALAFVFFRRLVAGQGNDPATAPLPPLDDAEVTGQALGEALSDLELASAALARGEVEEASRLLMGRPRRVAHNLDGPLWGIDPELGRRLCRCVLEATGELTGARDRERLASLCEQWRQALAEAGRLLGLEAQVGG